MKRLKSLLNLVSFLLLNFDSINFISPKHQNNELEDKQTTLNFYLTAFFLFYEIILVLIFLKEMLETFHKI